MDAKKALKKHNLFRTLKTIAYLAGFPLLLILFLQSSYFLGLVSPGKIDSMVNDTVKIFILMWLAVTVVQIIVCLITRSYSVRALCVVIPSVALMLGLSFLIDAKSKEHLNEMAESYARDYYQLSDEDTVSFKDGDEKISVLIKYDGAEEEVEYETPIYTYNEHLSEFKPWSGGKGLTGSIGSLQSSFTSTYNIGGSGSGSKNTDGTKAGAARENDDGEKEYWFLEKGNFYNPNGLYADAYVFGVDQAADILLTISRTQNKYKEQGKDADEELAKALAKAEASSAWKTYVKSDEYEEAYGKGGTAYKYMLTEERLDEMLAALGNGIAEDEFLGGTISSLKSVISSLVGFEISTDMLKGLTVDKTADLVDGFGAGASLQGAAAGFGLTATDYCNTSFDVSTTKGALLKLAGSFSYYQVPSVLPKMNFIENEEMRTYAYARYFAEIHGKNVGSVLYSADGTVGKITMSDSGTTASFTEEDLCTIRAYRNYSCKLLINNHYLFHLFLARRYAMFFAGVCAISYILAFFFAYKQHLYSIVLKNGCIAKDKKKGGKA